MNKHIPKVLKGIGIAFVLTLVIYVIGYTLFELAVYWDHHVNVARNRFGNWGFIKPFMELWFLHSCYCVICEFIPNNRRRLCRLGYLYSLIVWILIPFTSSGHPSTHGVIFRLSAFSMPFVILTRHITEKLVTRKKFIRAVLDWRVVYLFWAISFIVLLVLVFAINYPIIWEIYWWALGLATTLAGMYLLYKKQWIDGLLYFCLFLFPLMAFYIGSQIPVTFIQKIIGA